MEVIRIFTIILTILLGLCVGSFLNVVIYRLPNNMSLAKPASHCPKCQAPIMWYDNIPVLSYIILRGKCRHCHAPISPRYLIVELLNTILWFVCLLLFTNFIIPSFELNWLKFIVSCIVCSTLICVFFVDFDNKEIQDIFPLILLVCGLVLLLDDLSMETVMLKVFGFIGAGALFIIVNAIFKLIKKRDGVGFGDVELVSTMGLILGGYIIIFSLVISCVVGGIVLLILTSINKNKEKEYPFAVILVPGLLIGLFVGSYVVNWYLALLGVR